MARAWFPFYFADYAAKTEHLTLAEHGAYLLLMGAYYKTGCKLPANAKQLQRICRAFDAEEVAAMQSVLDQFFIQEGSHYIHTRIEEELQKSKEISEKRANAAKKRYENDANASAKADANAGAIAMQKDTQSQSQSQSHIQSQDHDMSGKPDIPLPRDQAKKILAFLNEKTGRNYEPVESNLKIIIARLKEYPPDKLRQVIAKKCREWASDEKMNQYLRPKTLFNATNFANYAGELIPVEVVHG